MKEILGRNILSMHTNLSTHQEERTVFLTVDADLKERFGK